MYSTQAYPLLPEEEKKHDLESQQLLIEEPALHPSLYIRSMRDFFALTRTTSLLTMIATEAKAQPDSLPKAIGVSLHVCLLANAVGTVKAMVVTSSPQLAQKYRTAFNSHDAAHAGFALYTFSFVTAVRNATLIHRYQTNETNYMVDDKTFWLDYNLPLMVVGLTRMILDPKLNLFPRITSPDGKLAALFQFMANVSTLQGAVAAGSVIARQPIPSNVNLILTNVVSTLVGLIGLFAMRSKNPQMVAITTHFMNLLWSTAHSLTQIALIMQFANYLGPWGEAVQMTAWLLMTAAVTVGPILIDKMQNAQAELGLEAEFQVGLPYQPPELPHHLPQREIEPAYVELLDDNGEPVVAQADQKTPEPEPEPQPEPDPGHSPYYRLANMPFGFHNHSSSGHKRAVSVDTGTDRALAIQPDPTITSPQPRSK